MKQQAFITVMIAAVMVSGFGSCGMSLQELCVSRFPTYEKQFGDAIAALAPWDENASRSLASEGFVPAEVIELHATDRNSWGHWAQDRLNETQSYMDLASEDPSGVAARRELSEMANELGTFHGYASAGRGGRMVAVLRRIEAHSAKIRQMTCPRVAQANLKNN